MTLEFFARLFFTCYNYHNNTLNTFKMIKKNLNKFQENLQKVIKLHKIKNCLQKAFFKGMIGTP